jgi:hypothetical protein
MQIRPIALAPAIDTASFRSDVDTSLRVAAERAARE